MEENFKNKIIEDFGLGKMEKVAQEKMIERIGNMLFESIIERSIDLLDENGLSKFEVIIASTGSGDYQKVINFLKDEVPGFKNVVSDELAYLKKTMSGVFS